jgi:hypothetical protein
MGKQLQRQGRPVIDNAVLVKQWVDGLSTIEIAKRHGVTRSAVNNHIYKLRRSGVKLPFRRNSVDVEALNKMIKG